MEWRSVWELGWELVYGLADQHMFTALRNMSIIIAMILGTCALMMILQLAGAIPPPERPVS